MSRTPNPLLVTEKEIDDFIEEYCFDRAEAKTKLIDLLVGARIEERELTLAEADKEHQLIRESDALDPNGLNGYYCAVRDLRLNSEDRIAQLNTYRDGGGK